MSTVISVRNLVKTYVVGEVERQGASRREPGGPEGRVPRGHWTIGLRQVDVHAHHRVSGPADVRSVFSRRGRRLAHVEGCAGRRPQHEDWFRVPGIQPAVPHHGARQRRVTAALSRRFENGRASPACAQSSRGGRSEGSRRSPSQPVVRRSAAARGHCPGAHQRAVDSPGRRTHREPRHENQH